MNGIKFLVYGDSAQGKAGSHRHQLMRGNVWSRRKHGQVYTESLPFLIQILLSTNVKNLPHRCFLHFLTKHLLSSILMLSIMSSSDI